LVCLHARQHLSVSTLPPEVLYAQAVNSQLPERTAMATANDPASIGTQGDDMLTTAERTDAGSADSARSVESPMPKLSRAEAALRDSEERYRLIA
jgi:hypothetical protein